MVESVVLHVQEFSFEKTAVEMAAVLGTKMKMGHIQIPDACGRGSFTFTDFKEYASVLKGEFYTEQQLMFQTLSPRKNFYTLVLTEHTDAGLERECEAISVQLFHSAMSNTVTCCYQTNMRVLMINFNQKLLNEYLLPEVSEYCLNEYFSRLQQDHLFTLMHNDLRELLNEVFSVLPADAFSDLKVFNRVMLILEALLLKINETPAKAKYPHKQLLVFQAIEAILVKDFSATPPSIEQLSAQFNIGTTHLKKTFKEIYGIPIYEYYQKCRMAYAKRLIKSNEYSMKEVGIRVGYTNLSHFAGAFKKEFGVLPSRFHARDKQKMLSA